jgi:dihydrofolate reductase
MKSVILQEFVSVNGMAAGPAGRVDFIPAATEGDRSFGKRQMEFIDSIDTMLLGRVTYQLFVQYWPNVTSGEDREFADRLNALQKVVFTNSLDRAPWGGFEPARIVKGSAVAEVEQLKQQTGKDMVVWGSLSLATNLMKQGLVDEYQLVVCPVVLGDGRPLFANGDTSGEMHLLTTRAFDRGTVLLSYAGAMATAGMR